MIDLINSIFEIRLNKIPIPITIQIQNRSGENYNRYTVAGLSRHLYVLEGKEFYSEGDWWVDDSRIIFALETHPFAIHIFEGVLNNEKFDGKVRLQRTNEVIDTFHANRISIGEADEEEVDSLAMALNGFKLDMFYKIFTGIFERGFCFHCNRSILAFKLRYIWLFFNCQNSIHQTFLYSISINREKCRSCPRNIGRPDFFCYFAIHIKSVLWATATGSIERGLTDAYFYYFKSFNLRGYNGHQNEIVESYTGIAHMKRKNFSTTLAAFIESTDYYKTVRLYQDLLVYSLYVSCLDEHIAKKFEHINDVKALFHYKKIYDSFNNEMVLERKLIYFKIIMIYARLKIHKQQVIHFFCDHSYYEIFSVFKANLIEIEPIIIWCCGLDTSISADKKIESLQERLSIESYANKMGKLNYSLDTDKIDFGKYKNSNINTIIKNDISYIIWAIFNIDYFTIPLIYCFQPNFLSQSSAKLALRILQFKEQFYSDARKYLEEDFSDREWRNQFDDEIESDYYDMMSEDGLNWDII